MIDEVTEEERYLYGLYPRTLLECLTKDKENNNTVGILVEFSFDGGATWEFIPCAIANLDGEAGIQIIEPNLAEITPKTGGTIQDENAPEMAGVNLNLWTSLVRDKLHYTGGEPEKGFKEGDWKTRVRVTACVQMDQRLRFAASPTAASGSPLRHVAVYDWSDRYTRQTRTESSTFYESDLPARQVDDLDTLAAHLDAVRYANEDMSVTGNFQLDRLWIDAADAPTFRIGDGVSKISGRNLSLYAARFQEGENPEPEGVYPEIAQITYDIERQTQWIITRDLRLSPFGS
jgi:hypothetical protein